MHGGASATSRRGACPAGRMPAERGDYNWTLVELSARSVTPWTTSHRRSTHGSRSDSHLPTVFRRAVMDDRGPVTDGTELTIALASGGACAPAMANECHAGQAMAAAWAVVTIEKSPKPGLTLR